MKHNQQPLTPNPRPLAPSPSPASRLQPAASSRRGVLLLVVLSLLVLFALIGVTFVLVAGRHLSTTRMALREEQTGDDPRKLSDAVLAQLVRDTTDTHSVLRGHSLLADLYGNDGVRGDYGNAALIAGGQFINLTMANVTPTQIVTSTQLQTHGHYNGCVLTMLDGAAANHSTRIVGWTFDRTSTEYTITVMAFEGVDSTLLTGTSGPFIINGRPFNGAGFGFDPTTDPSLPATTTLLNSTESLQFQDPNSVGVLQVTVPVEHALAPNPVFFRNNIDPNYQVFGGIGGADENYDAADPQNMALAYMPLNPRGPGDIIPSFHRPDLSAYILNRELTSAQPTLDADYWMHLNPDIVGRTMLRPFGSFVAPPSHGVSSPNFPDAMVDMPNPHHPTFSGGNPNFNPIRGPWDVDNDGDGIPDSVWVDVGFPVQTAPDGTTYKTLAAILCLDLDGRLNVNAHGSVAQVHPRYGAPIAPGASPNETIANFVYSNGPTNVALTPGSGYGPAEINLERIFPSRGDYSFFFSGRNVNGRNYEGRYGEFNNPSATYRLPLPGRSGLTGGARADDLLAAARNYGVPTSYYVGTPTAYGSPSDLWGRGIVAVDYAGQPIYTFLPPPGSSGVYGSVSSSANPAPPERPNFPLNPADPDSLRSNNPYVLNLSRRRVRSSEPEPTTTDNPFTVAELERILRQYDVDAGALPDRLRVLLDPNGANPNLSRLITTDSFDLPSPGMQMTRDNATLLRTQSGGRTPPSTNLLDLLRAKVIAADASLPPPGPFGYNYGTLEERTVWDRMLLLIRDHLPFEVVSGQRFDLNRPFGNGEDDNVPPNGVVDEPTAKEWGGSGSPRRQEVPTPWMPAGGIFTTGPAGMDLNRDGDVNGNDYLFVRQQYAKHLYLLMMLLTQDNPTFAWAVSSGVPLNQADQDQRELTARRIAQWAVNVVDFRDPDAIMTGFEYDINPYDGWTGAADGDLRSGDAQTRVVWGCEYPELLLTETMALHDRRVRDSDTDDGINNDRADSKNNTNEDPDLDQSGVPQGSVFFELYCPRPANDLVNGPQRQHEYPRELYDETTNRLHLGRMDAQTGRDPVWRIAITGSRATAANNVHPNDIDQRVGLEPDKLNFDPVPPPGLPADTDPEGFSVFTPLPTNSVGGQITIERIVWFSNTNPTGHVDQDRVYYNTGNMPTLLEPGRYALVGPRPITFIGKQTGGSFAAQQIRLVPNAVQVRNALGQDVYAANGVSNQPLPIVCSSRSLPTMVANWDMTMAPPGHNIGVSISEPLFTSTSYYKAPNAPYPALTYSTPLDKALDKTAGTPLADDSANGLGDILHTGTTRGYKTALLQRLANPLLPFNAATNPYITVDWQPIDLTVFNGEQRNGPEPLPMVPFDPDDPNWPDVPPNPFVNTNSLFNHERGAIGPADVNLWRLSPQYISGAQVRPAGGSDVFDYNLSHTLGFLNSRYGTPWPSGAATAPAYAGAPTPAGRNTFPWLTWNNRPFASAHELLLVPATSAEQLMRQFAAQPSAAANPYDIAATRVFHAPCEHLLNFMLTNDGAAGGAPYFYRLLDYVHVPSRFNGTETILNPDPAVNPALGSGWRFLPPFNTVSNYREPGRVNINTIPGVAGASPASPVWEAILNGGSGPSWQQIVTSRRGGLGGNVTDPLINSPSIFVQPFRSAGGDLFKLPNVPPPPVPGEVNATLMRPDPTMTDQPLFSPSGSTPYTDPSHHPYFRYERFTRLSNLLTTRSNVYAIWITLGYFEVRPTAVTFSHPDGYQLGQELGADTGEIERHRAFYIYDRSIPVGFEPGQDHNFKDGLLLERFIE